MLCWIQSCSSKDNLSLFSGGSYPKVSHTTKEHYRINHDEGLQRSLCFKPLNKLLFQAESKVCLPTLGENSEIPFQLHSFHKLPRADHPISLGWEKLEVTMWSENWWWYHPVSFSITTDPRQKPGCFCLLETTAGSSFFQTGPPIDIFFFFWPWKRGLSNGIEKDYGSPISEKAMTRSSGDRPPPITLCWWEITDWSWSLIC